MVAARSRRFQDNRDYRRRPPRRSQKFRILIVCEGRVTERNYFAEFQHHVRNPRVHVAIPDQPGVPLTVVQTAVKLQAEADGEATAHRDDNLRFDSVWAVFDVDDHPRIDEAKGLALRNNIHVAISNPCFELWALLHFQDQRAHIGRDVLRTRLRQYLPGYEKNLQYDRLTAAYEEAVHRAILLEEEAQRHGNLFRNPTTGVARLTELIRTK